MIEPEICYCKNQFPVPASTDNYSQVEARRVAAFHQSIPGFTPTPLVHLSHYAQDAGLKDVCVKDESYRFGLKAFKGLGGTYAMFRMICQHLHLDPEKTTLDQLKQAPYADQIRRMHFVTTTDGNHGKGVSYAAKVFGCQAHVYMPKGTVPVRAQSIREAGHASVEITDRVYDACVAWTRSLAQQNGWFLIQDTAWDGYEEVPQWIMQGYLTMVDEALAEMKEPPTHVFLQAGVGSMAGAVAAALDQRFPEHLPRILIVEPTEVACFYDSFTLADGKPHPARGCGKTMMAGLNCATPCSLAWEILGRCATGAFACGDAITCHGMRLLAHPMPGDKAVISGESGAVTMGLLDRLMREDRYRELRDQLQLDTTSTALLFSTEGDTDPENYRAIVGI